MSHVKITFSYSNFHDLTNSIIEIPETEGWLPEWRPGNLLLYTCLCGSRYRRGETAAHATLPLNVGLTSRF